MGLTTVLAYAMLFTVLMGAIVGLVMVFNDYIENTARNLDRQIELSSSQRGTDIEITSFSYTYTTTENITINVSNVGHTLLETSCIDLFIAREWMKTPSFTVTLLNTTFNPELWDPDEDIGIKTQKGLEAEDEIKVVTCDGVFDTYIFSPVCGDGICMPGEDCPIDNVSCSDEVCYDPTCLDGCGSEIIAGTDPGECEGSTGCNTDDCWCQGGVCCGKVNSACVDNEDCCSNLCSGGTCQP